MITAERLLLLISVTLFLSYLSGIIYNRTKIPDLVWLLLLGIVLGPVLGVFNATLFMNVFDLMILVTVALFAFSTGSSFNIQQILGHTSRAFNMALASSLAVMFSVGIVLNTLLPDTFNLVSGFLLGAMISGIDGLSISSLITGLSKDQKGLGEAGFFLQLEATLSDPIKVVAVSTILKMILLTGAGPRTAARDVLFTLVMSSVIGVGAGLLWGEIISRLRDRPLNYMMTIAVLFPIYVLSDSITGGGGGPISVFLFGAVLMNYGYVTKSLNMNRRSRIDRRKIKEYHDEITFLMKSMFFVYLGLVMQFEISLLAVSVILSVLLIVVRYIIASLLGTVQHLPQEQVVYYRLIFIQGPSSLVLTQLVTKYDPTGTYFAGSQVYMNIVVPVVLISIIFSSILSPMIAGKQAAPKPVEPPKPEEYHIDTPVEKPEEKNGEKEKKDGA